MQTLNVKKNNPLIELNFEGYKKGREKLKEIQAFYLEHFDQGGYSLYPSLLKGLGGTILIQSLFYRAQKKQSVKKNLAHTTNILLESIEKTDPLFSTFCSGLAGTGWLLLYLKENKLLQDSPEDLFEQIDHILSKELTEMLKQGLFDFLHGGIGLGVYFLKRNNIPALEEIIQALEKTAVYEGDEIKWAFFHYVKKEQVYDFGLAHGIASRLYFLTKCLEKNIMPGACLKLITGVIKFYVNNLQTIDVCGAYFPHYVKVADYSLTDKTQQESRLAWCYGDLCILNTLYLAANSINDESLLLQVTKMLVQTTTRKKVDETNIIDAAFCHGASGVTIIYWNLYIKTGNPKFKTASIFWLKKTLTMTRKEANAVCGFLFSVEGVGDFPLIDILDGLGGIALALCALGYRTKLDWTECFLIT